MNRLSPAVRFLPQKEEPPTRPAHWELLLPNARHPNGLARGLALPNHLIRPSLPPACPACRRKASSNAGELDVGMFWMVCLFFLALAFNAFTNAFAKVNPTKSANASHQRKNLQLVDPVAAVAQPGDSNHPRPCCPRC